MAPPSARDTSWLNIAGSRFESRHGRTYYRVAVCGADPETGFAEAASAYRRFGEFQRCREALLDELRCDASRRGCARCCSRCCCCCCCCCSRCCCCCCCCCCDAAARAAADALLSFSSQLLLAIQQPQRRAPRAALSAAVPQGRHEPAQVQERCHDHGAEVQGAGRLAAAHDAAAFRLRRRGRQHARRPNGRGGGRGRRRRRRGRGALDGQPRPRRAEQICNQRTPAAAAAAAQLLRGGAEGTFTEDPCC